MEPYTTHLLRHYRRKIGTNIHRIRAKQRLPLQKLARLADIAPENLDYYELGKGEIPFHHILRLACVLGVEIEIFLK
jgi:transcriptional regulator with XRE-family HTH domain